MEDQQAPQQPQAVINNQPAAPAKPPKKKSGAGKKILLGLLVLIFVAGAGFAGYTYAANQAQKEQDAKVAELQSQIDGLKADAQKAVADAESAQDSKLVIKEWSVQLDPTDSTMLYRITSSSDGTEIVYLTNTKVQSLTGCKATKDAPELGYLAALSRYKTKPSTAEPNSTYVTQVGDYYYYVAGSQALCSTDKADQQLETDQRTALIESAKSVQASE